jgi:hypothetical protein
MLQDKRSQFVGETDVIRPSFVSIVMLFDAVLLPGVKSCYLDNFDCRSERLITIGFVIILIVTFVEIGMQWRNTSRWFIA